MNHIFGAPTSAALLDDLKALGQEFHAANAAHRTSASPDPRWPPYYDDYLRYFGIAAGQLGASATDATRDAIAKKIAAYRAGLAVHRRRMSAGQPLNPYGAPPSAAPPSSSLLLDSTAALARSDPAPPAAPGFRPFLERQPKAALAAVNVGAFAAGVGVGVALWQSRRLLGGVLGGIFLGPIIGGAVLATWYVIDKKRRSP